jgi:flavodoxin
MQPLVIYFTRTNNSIAIAEAVAAELDADLVRVGDQPDVELERQMRGRELIVFASGIYNSRPPKQILHLIPKLPAGAGLAYVFTSGITSSFMVRWYKGPILRAVAKHGVNLLGIWNGPGHDKHPLFKWANLNAGRPNQQDFVAIKAFIAALEK